MRINKLAIVVVSLALLIANTLSVTGQQDDQPLPRVMPHEVVEPAIAEPSATIALAAEPIRGWAPPTLAEAARANDFATFDALYTEAKRRGENVDAFASLHELWSWAISDPIGAFYGRETYERLARAHDGYAAYIADHAIVDSRGNTFWPTSETRAFLLDRATRGELPKTQLAESPAKPPQKAPAPKKGSAPKPAVVASAPAPMPVPRPIAVARPVVIHAEPLVIQAEPMVEQTQVVATPRPQPVAAAPVPVVPESAPAPVQDVKPSRTSAFISRGMLLLVLGLIGIGLLTVIFREPREDDELAPSPAIVENVEPIRKRAPPAEPPRATGSHG